MELNYPHKKWMRDIILWASVTELANAQQGPAVVLQLFGVAREIADQLDDQTLQYGTTTPDADGHMVQLSGIAVSLRGLFRKLAPLGYENGSRAIYNLLSFRRQPNEAVDIALSRFDIVRLRAQNEGQFELPPTSAAYMLLTSFGIPPLTWSTFLVPTQCNLPVTDQQLTDMQEYIRRQSHLLEHGSIANIGNSAGQQNHFAQQQMFMTQALQGSGTMFGGFADVQSVPQYDGNYMSNPGGGCCPSLPMDMVYALQTPVAPGTECDTCGMFV